MNRCIEMNLETLDRLRELLSSMEPASYRQSHPQFFDSSIGGHVRHILEFYELFLGGLESGTIDYSRRKRDQATEEEPSVALAMIDFISDQAKDLSDGPITVISESGDAFESSRGRELEFLSGHAVHHNAMIVAISQSQGISVSSGIAFANSTLEYRRASA